MYINDANRPLSEESTAIGEIGNQWSVARRTNAASRRRLSKPAQR